MFDGGGSNLAFGTSNSFGSGITNTAMFIHSDASIDITGNTTFSSDGNYRATNSGAINVSPNGNLAIGFGGDSDANYYAAIFHNSSNTAVGSIFVDASSTTFATSSDHRLKENVANLTGAIDRVKTLAPKRFNFIADPDTTVDGFLAHEVTAVPEAIVGTHNQVDDDNNPVYQGIDQSKLVPLLTAALQEAIAKIETLETKVAALEAG